MGKKGLERTLIFWIVGLAALAVILLIVFTPLRTFMIAKIKSLFSFLSYSGARYD